MMDSYRQARVAQRFRAPPHGDIPATKQHNSITPSNISRRYAHGNTLMCFTIIWCTLHETLPNDTVNYCAIPNDTILYCTLLYKTTLYYTLIPKLYDSQPQWKEALCDLCWATKRKRSSRTPAMMAPNNCWTTDRQRGRQIDRQTGRQKRTEN